MFVVLTLIFSVAITICHTFYEKYMLQRLAHLNLFSRIAFLEVPCIRIKYLRVNTIIKWKLDNLCNRKLISKKMFNI